MHLEKKRIVPNASTAVLLIHGIVGTPSHFRNLIPLEEGLPDSWSVWTLCLPGHGGTVEDFSHSSMKQWKSYVWAAFRELADEHEKIVLIGHSMGTLFALQLASQYPDQVRDLFLLAVPLRPHIGFAIVNSSLRLVFGKIREDHPMETSIVSACGSQPTKKLWRYIPWLPRFVELLVEIYKTEKILSDIQIPYRIFQSRKDELVSNRSEKILIKHGLHVTALPDSGHFYYAPEDKRRILASFADMKKQA